MSKIMYELLKRELQTAKEMLHEQDEIINNLKKDLSHKAIHIKALLIIHEEHVDFMATRSIDYLDFIKWSQDKKREKQ